MWSIDSITPAYLQIHPFQDGNGRTGRALLVYALARLGFRLPCTPSTHQYVPALQQARDPLHPAHYSRLNRLLLRALHRAVAEFEAGRGRQ